MQYGFPLAEAVPLHAALLSLPLTTDYAPLTMSPEQQKQQTLHALLTPLLRIAAQQNGQQGVQRLLLLLLGRHRQGSIVRR